MVVGNISACWSMLQNLPEEDSLSWEGEMTVENTLGERVGCNIMSTEHWESKGFHRVLEEPELGVLRLPAPELGVLLFPLPELGVLRLPLPVLGVPLTPLYLGVLMLELGVLALLLEWGVFELPFEFGVFVLPLEVGVLALTQLVLLGVLGVLDISEPGVPTEQYMLGLEWGLEVAISDVWPFPSPLLGVLKILSAKLPSEREEDGPVQLMELRLEEMENCLGVVMEETAMVLDMASENQSGSVVSSEMKGLVLVFSLSCMLGMVFISGLDWLLSLKGTFSVRIL